MHKGIISRSRISSVSYVLLTTCCLAGCAIPVGGPGGGSTAYTSVTPPANAKPGTLLWRYDCHCGGFQHSSPAVATVMIAGVAKEVVFEGSYDKNVYAFDPLSTTTDASFDHVPSPKVLWHYATNGAVQSSPAVADGVIYVGSDDNTIYALNASDGSLRWKVATGGAAIGNSGLVSSPAVVNGVVYVGSADGHLYALKASDGSLVWKFAAANPQQPQLSPVESSPAVVNGVVYFGANSLVYAVHARDGSPLWTYDTNNQPPGGNPPPGNPVNVNTSPAVVHGVVYVSTDRTVYALNASKGSLLWKVATGSSPSASQNGGDWPRSSPRVANGVVYVGAVDHNVYALNARDGSLLWKVATGGTVLSSPAVVNGVVYIGSDDGNVYALNARDGSLHWKYSTGTPPNAAVDTSPTIVDGVIYVGSGDAYALTT